MSGNHRQIWGFPLKIWLFKENDSKYIAVLIKLNAQRPKNGGFDNSESE